MSNDTMMKSFTDKDYDVLHFDLEPAFLKTNLGYQMLSEYLQDNSLINVASASRSSIMFSADLFNPPDLLAGICISPSHIKTKVLNTHVSSKKTSESKGPSMIL
jgi:hypothetical protein